MKSNVPLLNVLDTNYKKATICISELILTPFSPFDIKCKKLNANRDNPVSSGRTLPCLVILFKILF